MKQNCLSVEGRPPANTFLLLWPWHWPHDLAVRTCPEVTTLRQYRNVCIITVRLHVMQRTV